MLRDLLASARLRLTLVTAAAIIVPTGVAAALIPFRGDVADATVALGLAIVVSLVAAVGNRATALLAAITAALSFDDFFTKPYGSLTISSAQDIETTALLLVGGMIVGQLAARNREHRRVAAQTRDDLERIQAIAEMVASGAGGTEVVSAVAVELQRVLSLRKAWFETTRGDEGGPVIERNGEVSWGRFWWGVSTLGLPGKKITLAVENQQQRVGRYVLLAEPGARVTREQLLAAVTLADQAGMALGSGATSA